MAQPERGSLARATLTLLLAAGLCAGALRALENSTEARVAANAERARSERIGRLLASVPFDNAPHRDMLVIDEPFSGLLIRRLYRVRVAGSTTGYVVEVRTRYGYGGPIDLLVAVSTTRAPVAVVGIEILSHRETPGLGDRIEPTRSQWLDGFGGRSFDSPPRQRWAVRRDGGEFDALTGATVTSRAVIAAVAGALEFVARYREE